MTLQYLFRASAVTGCRTVYFVGMHGFPVSIHIGLSLIINVQQDQYVSEVGNTAGLIVLALPQHLVPFPEDHGILVRPGYETEVALSLVCFASNVMW